MANYYYIVSGLPDLLLDQEQKTTVSLDTFIREMADLLPEKDYNLLPLIRFPEDNKNIITLLTERNRKFSTLGNFDQETLQAELKTFDQLPEYARNFINAFRQGKAIHPRLQTEDQLALLFYEAMLTSPDYFIREWFSFELKLRNIIAAVDCRKYGGDKEASIIDLDEVSRQILKSTAPDFSLSSRCPWAEKILQQEQTLSVTEYAKTIDQIRWRQIDEIPLTDVFSIGSILGFCIKLQITERWQSLEMETGKTFLDKLIKELESSYLEKEAAAGGS
ncbi:MAG TPA: DUF2764 family protein [Spirochaetota bacterium]|nr:DUF2764 family protein [Spirochaetota bacterium]